MPVLTRLGPATAVGPATLRRLQSWAARAVSRLLAEPCSAGWA